jgi:hypothetical protein
MNQALPFTPLLDETFLLKFFKKGYYKMPYNRFMWWKGYTPKNKPLSARHTLRERITNGDFDIAPQHFEAMLVEHRMNKKWVELRGEEDQWREHTSVDKARRKRLLEDYEKEERIRLDDLKKAFVLTFKMTKEQYDKEVVNTRSVSLIKFFEAMEKKYGTYWKPLSYKGKT